jgi:hypothetical protein
MGNLIALALQLSKTFNVNGCLIYRRHGALSIIKIAQICRKTFIIAPLIWYETTSHGRTDHTKSQEKNKGRT